MHGESQRVRPCPFQDGGHGRRLYREGGPSGGDGGRAQSGGAKAQSDGGQAQSSEGRSYSSEGRPWQMVSVEKGKDGEVRRS